MIEPFGGGVIETPPLFASLCRSRERSARPARPPCGVCLTRCRLEVLTPISISCDGALVALALHAAATVETRPRSKRGRCSSGRCR